MADLNLQLGAIARTVRGTLMGHGEVRIDQVTTDSRKKVSDALFVALKGERFDGHDFASVAVANGATAVMVQKQIDGLMAPHIVVPDTLVALQTLGAWRRRQFKGTVAAITGSSGKTTTRRMLHAIWSEVGLTHQPAKNFNNHIGLPLTLLDLDDAHHAAALELGCSDFGEIRLLTKLADPDVGLVTNVGPAHLEKLGSLEGVARAKEELFLGMRTDTVAVVNRDDPRVAAMDLKSVRRVTFGIGESADVRLASRAPAGGTGQQIVVDMHGERISLTLRFLGAHNASDALAAIAMACAVDTPVSAIVAGLERLPPEPGRLALVEGTRPLVIDDSYNANPASMRAALLALKEMGEGRKIFAVLGDMLELGQTSDSAHRQLGALAAALPVDGLVTLGERSTGVDAAAAKAGLDESKRYHAPSHEAAVEKVREWTSPEDVVLVKGSRGMRMEQVVELLLKEMR